MTTNVPPGIDYARVSRWFAANVPGGGDAPLTFDIIGDGRSNITYRVTNGNETWVMRRPPLGHVLPTAHDMVREFRVLTGVTRAGYPAPKPIALCEDTAVNDYPFYVMEYRDGVIVVNELPAGFATSEAERTRICLAMIDAMVQLHAIDYDAVGLGDFGRPAGYLERQVRRWSQQWEANKTGELPEIDELIRRLNAAIPQSPPPTIVHGDFRLGNMILDRDDPGRVVAVLDWEMSTLGDPLADLGYTLAFWGDPDDPPVQLNTRPGLRVTTQPGFLNRKQLAEEYAKRSGRDVANIAFYEIFAKYKLAVITEGIYNRYLQGKATFSEAMARGAPTQVQLALAQADASDDPRLRGEF